MQGQTQEAEQMHCGHMPTPTCGSQTERKRGNIGKKEIGKPKIIEEGISAYLLQNRQECKKERGDRQSKCETS